MAGNSLAGWLGSSALSRRGEGSSRALLVWWPGGAAAAAAAAAVCSSAHHMPRVYHFFWPGPLRLIFYDAGFLRSLRVASRSIFCVRAG